MAGQHRNSEDNVRGGGGVALNFEEIRRLTIIALFSDDVLLERLVLKGVNH